MVHGGFRAREIDWRKSRVPKKFFWPPMGVPHVKKSIFSIFLFWLQIGWFLVFGGFQAREIDCAHRKILKKFFGGQKIEKNASKLGVVSFNPNKIIFGGFWPPKNFFRIFQCAQSIPRTKLPLKMILLGLKLITPNFDAFFQFFDPRKIFPEFFDARNRFLA